MGARCACMPGRVSTHIPGRYAEHTHAPSPGTQGGRRRRRPSQTSLARACRCRGTPGRVSGGAGARGRRGAGARKGKAHERPEAAGLPRAHTRACDTRPHTCVRSPAAAARRHPLVCEPPGASATPDQPERALSARSVAPTAHESTRPASSLAAPGAALPLLACLADSTRCSWRIFLRSLAVTLFVFYCTNDVPTQSRSTHNMATAVRCEATPSIPAGAALGTRARCGPSCRGAAALARARLRARRPAHCARPPI